MTPSDFTQEELVEFFRNSIIRPNPEVFEDKKRRDNLIHIADCLMNIEAEYFKLLSIVKSDKEVARLFFEHHDWLPILKAANGPLQHVFDTEQLSLESILLDCLGAKVEGGRSRKPNKKNADGVVAIRKIQEYIDGDDAYQDCPKPPHKDLLECILLMVDPKNNLTKRYEGTFLEDDIEVLFRGGLNLARSRENTKGGDRNNPKPGEVSVGIKKYVKTCLKSVIGNK
ncbi:MAG: hypothetical protein O3C20_19355 [Verrucomicrobia bacterium]|nr:hypothetical protein [Verrucomicrobiota bacterium]